MYNIHTSYMPKNIYTLCLSYALEFLMGFRIDRAQICPSALSQFTDVRCRYISLWFANICVYLRYDAVIWISCSFLIPLYKIGTSYTPPLYAINKLAYLFCIHAFTQTIYSYIQLILISINLIPLGVRVRAHIEMVAFETKETNLYIYIIAYVIHIWTYRSL